MTPYGGSLGRQPRDVSCVTSVEIISKNKLSNFGSHIKEKDESCLESLTSCSLSVPAALQLSFHSSVRTKALYPITA